MNEAQKLAETVREQHFTIACAEDFNIAQESLPIYTHSKALFIAVIALAYPEVPAKAVYNLWVDCSESVEKCAKWLIDNPGEVEFWD